MSAGIGQTSDALRTLGACVNLCFHNIVDQGRNRDRYSVDVSQFEAILHRLEVDGLAPCVRLYFDDNHLSFVNKALPRLSLHRYLAVVAAVPATTIGREGFMTWDDLFRIAGAGVSVVPHGYDHVRLASYSNTGELLSTPPDGPYLPLGDTNERPLTENEVMFQLIESFEVLRSFQPAEFVLPYGCLNVTTVGINDRWGLYETLSTSDFDLDIGQELRPRFLIETSMTEHEVVERIAAVTRPQKT